ncbi:hypothetical protein GCM10023115_24810 [Pontixanthobacter gangjinensis]|uniref:DUF4304 domain-containing protein n=1 Tax=Christiangramia aestuarii TaxID=1028746 RepID=A0A7K1LT07_9FLAO|nr:DUF4304 domain-containing protein [Christiangramia aestuarii]MUP43886.1 DUF4304 domain-containing protein [Christiangramia aestuarii]
MWNFTKKSKDQNSINSISEMNKPDYGKKLDLIQKEIHQFLKPLGFKKRGRTFNREVESGLFQVINFQSGQFPVGDNYEIPGVRESFYGKFTVNLGVCIEELYLIEFSEKKKPFYQEYDCQIRNRLETIIQKTDKWWEIDSDSNNSKIIIDGLKFKGFEWFQLFDTREKIIKNWGDPSHSHSSRAQLDVALIVLQTDKNRGAKLIQDYFENIENDKSSHKKYVIDLAKRFDIKIKQ